MEKHFQNDEKALQYAIHNQRNRRNMTEADLLKCIELVDKRREAGRPPKELAPNGANLSQGKSAETTAKIVGASRRKVERARKVLSDPKEKEEVACIPPNRASLSSQVQMILGLCDGQLHHSPGQVWRWR